MWWVPYHCTASDLIVRPLGRYTRQYARRLRAWHCCAVINDTAGLDAQQHGWSVCGAVPLSFDGVKALCPWPNCGALSIAPVESVECAP